MPLTLAVDCCNRAINAAIGADGRAIASETRASSREQSSALPAIVESLAAAAGATLKDLGLVAVTTGPGYYTGIRVGLAYASALAESVGAMLVTMTSLRAMAQTFIEADAHVVSVIKARAGEVYAAAWQHGEQSVEERFCTLDEIASYADAGSSSRPIFVCGEAEMLRELKARGITAVMPDGAAAPAMLRAALDIAPIDPTAARAIYLRPPN